MKDTKEIIVSKHINSSRLPKSYDADLRLLKFFTN